MDFELHQIQPDGMTWHSGKLEAETEREIHQRILTGWLPGQPRWATSWPNTTQFFSGRDAEGKIMTGWPTVVTEKRKVRVRGRARAAALARAEARTGAHIDGLDRDDLGESPDY